MFVNDNVNANDHVVPADVAVVVVVVAVFLLLLLLVVVVVVAAFPYRQPIQERESIAPWCST